MQALSIHKFVLHLNSFDMLYENINDIFYEIFKIMGPTRLEIYHLKPYYCKMSRSPSTMFVYTNWVKTTKTILKSSKHSKLILCGV